MPALTPVDTSSEQALGDTITPILRESDDTYVAFQLTIEIFKEGFYFKKYVSHSFYLYISG